MKSGLSIQNLKAGTIIRLTPLLHATPSMLEHSCKFFIGHRSIRLQLCFKTYLLSRSAQSLVARILIFTDKSTSLKAVCCSFKMARAVGRSFPVDRGLTELEHYP